MKLFTAILVLLLVVFQYQLWLDKGGIPEVIQLDKDIAVTSDKVEKLKERNQRLAAEVKDLKQGIEAIEERARTDLGMIKQSEKYYQVIDTKTTSPKHFKPSENKR